MIKKPAPTILVGPSPEALLEQSRRLREMSSILHERSRQLAAQMDDIEARMRKADERGRVAIKKSDRLRKPKR